MRLWMFDRSGPYNSENFDIHKEPERCIRVIAGYALMTDAELGLNTFIKRDVNSNNDFFSVYRHCTSSDLVLKLNDVSGELGLKFNHLFKESCITKGLISVLPLSPKSIPLPSIKGFLTPASLCDFIDCLHWVNFMTQFHGAAEGPS
ncbi:MAG: uncharacterized protein FRX48_09207 [Lasallia pustulata]|uniref:Fungal-type protein kinase domain-containing protein n=1 Tax=Lasallia pustulata TaxID=136370 RepID=A0A5M8PC82_9LECA|nr:MAG: uncharacterized protein FRX48_09207 [Lasallia pustulata]